MSTRIEQPGEADFSEESHWKELAHLHWAKHDKPPKVKDEVIKNELWDILENEGFQLRSLLVLENLQILEKFLWPGFSENSIDCHVVLTALIINAKCGESLPVWGISKPPFSL